MEEKSELRHSNGVGSSLKEYWTGWKIMSQLVWLFGSKKLASVMENYQVKIKIKKKKKWQGESNRNYSRFRIRCLQCLFQWCRKAIIQILRKEYFFQNGKQTNEVKYYADLPKKRSSQTNLTISHNKITAFPDKVFREKLVCLVRLQQSIWYSITWEIISYKGKR